jgi:hypothetical protein
MKYALLIYESAAEFDARGGDDPAFWGAWTAYAEALRKAGHHVGGSGLEPPATGTTVRHSHGERAVQDGPYADTKEQLGGFFLIDVPDLDAALDWAARCPVRQGAVEVRPVLGSCQASSEMADRMRVALAK